MNGLVHVLLIVYLLYFTSVSQTSTSWLKLGYFLTAYFMSEAVVRIVVRNRPPPRLHADTREHFLLSAGDRRAVLFQEQRVSLPVRFQIGDPSDGDRDGGDGRGSNRGGGRR